jgi:hypothetical protein
MSRAGGLFGAMRSFAVMADNADRALIYSLVIALSGRHSWRKSAEAGMNGNQVRLRIGTPCYGGVVTTQYMQSICSLLCHKIPDLQVSIVTVAYESLITRGRNAIVAGFLDQPAETHLMFIDADIGFSVDQVQRMLNFNRDVVAGMYPLKLLDYDEAAFQRAASGEPLQTAQLRYVGVPCEGEERETTDGFVTGVYAGAGFLLIKRRVLELMAEKYRETRYTAAHDSALPSQSPNLFALFDCLIDRETGSYLSEDYAFCSRWRALGGTIWLDSRSKLTHVGPYNFVGNTIARFT